MDQTMETLDQIREFFSNDRFSSNCRTNTFINFLCHLWIFFETGTNIVTPLPQSFTLIGVP